MSFFLPSWLQKQRAHSKGVNTKCRYWVSYMKKVEAICGKKEGLYEFILNKKFLSYLYLHKRTYLELVRPNALTDCYSSSPILQIPGSSSCHQVPMTFPQRHRRLFPSFSLHLAVSFFQVFLRWPQTVKFEVRTEKHPLQWSTHAAAVAGHSTCWMLDLASASKSITAMQWNSS